MAIKELEKGKKYKISIYKGRIGSKEDFDYYTFYGTKTEAKLKEAEYKSQLKNNTYLTTNKMTVNNLIDEWLIYKENKLAIKTFKNYRHICHNISKSLGHIRLNNLTTKLLEDFYNDLINNTDFSTKTIKHYQTLMNTMLNDAKKWGYIHINPNENIERIKVVKKEIKFYTPQEVELLLEALKDEPIKHRALIYLALDSGARRGELTGLTWDDVDFENKRININKTTQYVTGVGVFEKGTKNTTSNRVVYLSDTTINILKQYHMEQMKLKLKLGNKWGNSERVFTNEYGFDMFPNTPSNILTKILKKYNLKYINFHALRHTSISLLANSNVPIQLVSKKAGHSNLKTTTEIYSHFYEDTFKEIANTMNNYLKDTV